MSKSVVKKVILAISMVLGSTIIISLYSLECLKNHNKALNAIGDLVESKVLFFYKKNKRYPLIEESLEFFKEAGCEDITPVIFRELKYESGEVYRRSNSFLCKYNSKFYKYNVSDEGDIHEAYDIRAGKGNTKCSAFFYKEGEVINSFGCQQFSCISLSH